MPYIASVKEIYDARIMQQFVFILHIFYVMDEFLQLSWKLLLLGGQQFGR